MLRKFTLPLFVLALCCGALSAQEYSHTTNYGTAAAVSPTFRSAQKDTVKAFEKALQKAIAKEFHRQAVYCERCGEAIESKGQHCQKADYTDMCQPAKTYVQVNADECIHCRKKITDPYQHCTAQQGTALCEKPDNDEWHCTECGRTPDQVSLSGHNHKPPYAFRKISRQKGSEALKKELKFPVGTPDSLKKPLKKTPVMVDSNSSQAKKPYF